MELYQLQYAIALSEHRNFTTAAESIFISQPTLSQQIQKLEQEFGCSLFLRDSHQVSLTTAGELFIQKAKRVIADADDLKKEMTSFSRMLSNKVIFGSSLFSSTIIANVIPTFFAQFPQLNFQLVEAFDPELIEMVHSSEIDLALVSIPNTHEHRKSLTVIPVKEEYVCAVLKNKHSLAKNKFISIEDLANYNLVFSSPKSGVKQTILRKFEELGLKPKSTLDVAYPSTRLSLILDDMISFAFSEQKRWSSFDDVILLPVEPKMESTFAIILRKEEKPSIIMDTLIQIIQNETDIYFGSTVTAS
jgi:DNA-binding transcriptional LysR family regulator